MQLNKLAFTLIELLVVIAVIGILSGLIVVSMNGTTQKATIAKGQIFSSSLRNSLMSNLISEWKFDEGQASTVSDSWSRISNGTWTGAEGTNTSANWRPSSECLSGQCLDFDGYDDNVSFSNYSRLTASSNWTFEHWMMWSGQSNSCVFYAGVGGTRPNFLLRNCSSENKFAFRPSGGTGSYYSFVSSAEYIGKWTHVVWTADNDNNISLYVNGRLELKKPIISPENTSITIASIGRSYGGTSYTYLGKIDEVRFYDSILPFSQIRKNYYLGLNSLLLNGVITKEEYLSRINEYAVK
jgi:prepilin-type N-terminal cleavage/methylation domain-containing protein